MEDYEVIEQFNRTVDSLMASKQLVFFVGVYNLIDGDCRGAAKGSKATLVGIIDFLLSILEDKNPGTRDRVLAELNYRSKQLKEMLKFEAETTSHSADC